MKKVNLLFFLLVLLVVSCNKKKLEKEKDLPPKIVEQEIKKDTISTTKKVKARDQSLIFMVQIGAYKKANSQLSKITNVLMMQERNLYKYRLGGFKTYKEARKLRGKLLTKYPDAFVQAIYNNKPIHITEALNK